MTIETYYWSRVCAPTLNYQLRKSGLVKRDIESSPGYVNKQVPMWVSVYKIASPVLGLGYMTGKNMSEDGFLLRRSTY